MLPKGLNIRPAYAIALGVLFVLLTAGLLFKAGILPESSWIEYRSGGVGGGSSLAGFQAALDASLRRSEERIQAKLDGGGMGSGGGGPGPGGAAAYPNSDVSKLLAKYPAGSSEYKELQKQRYCREEEEGASSSSTSRMMRWAPAPGKHLLTLCDYGQISNRLNCFRWYMLLAALLNRTLVMPEREASPKGYAYSLVLDVEHARGCLNNNNATMRTVVTLQEYLDGRGGKAAAVDSVWCWREKCSLEGYAKMFPAVAMPANVSGNEYRNKISSVAELVRQFGALPDAMISFGNLFGLGRLEGVPPEAYTAPNLPLAHQTCRLLIQPHAALVLAAKGFAKTIIGSRYMAVHLRRGDFHHFWGPYCHRKKEEGKKGGGGQSSSSFATTGCNILSMGAIGNCILEKLEGSGISIVYMATNAQPTELAVLESILRANPRGGPPVTLVRAPPALGQENYYWANSWAHMGLDAVPLAHATLDKLLCAMAKVFMGSVGSTFTDDIVTMRAGLGTLTCHDQPVCAVYAVSDRDRLPDFNITFTDPYQGTRNYRRRRRL